MTQDQIWESIVSKPKWYAGIVNEHGGFYNAHSARNLKIRYKNKTLSDHIIERVLNSHGYYLEKSWVVNIPPVHNG